MNNFLSIGSVFQYIGYILLAIVVLLFMILIHELGHYTAGKILKFKIDEFSGGFGPKILQKTKKDGQKVTLRLFPLGGYCAFAGENEDGTETENSFNKQPVWKRLIVMFCGAFFNFLSAIVFSFILLMANGYEFYEFKTIAETSIVANTVQVGDVIYGVNGTNVDFVNDNILQYIIADDYAEYKGEDITTEHKIETGTTTRYLVTEDINLKVKRDGKFKDVPTKVNIVYDEQGNYLQFTFFRDEYSEDDEVVVALHQFGLGEALINCVPFTCRWVWKILKIFGQLLTGQLDIKNLGGPVTTIKMMATATQQNFAVLLVLIPVISVNLAVFNLLPIPALDGFQMIFLIIEAVRRKPVKREVINAINNIGLIVLLLFVATVDILQFVL